MRKRATLASIDVGTTKVCTSIAEVNDEGVIRVAGVGVTPSSGMHKGMVVDISSARESIRESVRKAEQVSGCRVESAYIGVTGRHVSCLNNRGTVSITRNDRVVRPNDLRRVLKCAQSIEVPSERRLLHVIPRSYALDGQTKVKDPVGMHGSRLDVETHVITAAITSVKNLVKCIQSAGVDIEELVLEPLASSEAVLTEDEKQAGVILADIGGGTTDVAIFKDGSIWHTAIISVAGYQLTRDIAVGLGLPFDVAEEMKKRHGSVMSIYEGQNEVGTIDENGPSASYRALCSIIRARVEEVLRLIMFELPESEYKAMVPAGLVLTGGSANLSGIDTLGRDILRLPVRVGAPVNMHGITDGLRDPAYATSLGLLLWGIKHQDTQDWKFNGFGANLRRLVLRISDLFR